MTTGIDYGQLAQWIENMRAETMLRESYKARDLLRLEDQGFIDLPIDLSKPELLAGGLQFPQAHGSQVFFMRRVSTPGALLMLNVAGMTKPIGPGDSVEGRFDSLVVTAYPGSVLGGTAVLRCSANPQARYVEFPGDNITVAPANLLGSLSPSGAIATVSVLKDVDPTGVAPAGSFSCSGWKKILLLIDTTSNGGTATTFTVVPWYQPVVTAAGASPAGWFEEGTQAVDVPDTYVSGGAFRIIPFNLTGAQGQMMFVPRNVLAVARTALNQCVLGIG